jgi:gluconate 5-dehydrogenase
MGPFDITGKRALVVGMGGLGAAIARGLAENGARVAVADVDRSRAEAVAADLRRYGEAIATAVDVTSEASAQSMTREVLAHFTAIDILVNAAGVTVRKSAEELTVEDWQRVMDVNSGGVFVCSQVVGKEMIAAGGGKIVNISSVKGRYPSTFAQAEYTASKGAVDALTRALAAQWAKYHVYVNAIAPTVIETELTRPLLADESVAAALRESIPLGRWGRPADVVGPALFFASPASDFVTGQVLYVDGGLTARI